MAQDHNKFQSGKRMRTGLLRPGDLEWIVQSQWELRQRLLALGIHGQALQKELKANRVRLRKALDINSAYIDRLQ